MGRYFETAKPTFVDDVIYQAPYELIARALQNKDLAAEKDTAEIDEFDILGDDKKYTEQDKEKRNQILDDFRGEANSIAEQIQQDPQNRNFYMRKINSARKKFDKEISTGFLNDADRNFEVREASRKTILDRKDISEEQRSTALAQLDQDFKGSDSIGEGNTFSDNFHIFEALDEEKFIKDKKSEIVANSITTKENRTDGRYFTTDSGSRKFISNERLDSSFENSTGVGKWEKALLQKLEWQVDQGVISEDTMATTFNSERETFKQDYIKSLGFEQTTTADGILSRDGTSLAEQANARAWAKHNKDMEIIEEKGKVLIDRPLIPVPVEDQTKEDIQSAGWNKAAKDLKESIRLKLVSTGEFTTTPAEVQGEGPIQAPQENTEALNLAVEEEYNRTIQVLKLPIETRREATNKMIKDGYLKSEVTDLLNYAHNKEEVYDAEKMSSEEKKSFKTSTYPTIPPTLEGQVTFPDGTVKNMTKAEFEKAAEQLIPTKKSVKSTLSIKGDDGKVYAAYKASSGKLYALKKKGDSKTKVLLSEYDPNTQYANGKVAGTEKTTEMVGVVKPFNIKDMNLSTTDKLKFNSPTQEGVPSTKINVHVKTSEGPMIFRINRADVNQYEQ